MAEWQVGEGNSGAKEEEGWQNGKWVKGIVGQKKRKGGRMASGWRG